MHKFRSILAGMMIGIVLLNTPNYAESEKPVKVYFGTTNAKTVLNNIDFTDLTGPNIWSKEAVYSTAALDIMKGYGNRVFGREDTLTKAQGIALAYRAAAREAEAIVAAEALEASKQKTDRINDALTMWSQGYFTLARQDGLITAQDLQDAISLEKADMTEENFNPDLPLPREDFAFYLAKLIGISPVYGQQKIFNQYNDWKTADPLRVPYIEALLVNDIMNGDGNGYLYPKGYVTREQAAQMIRNAMPIIAEKLKLERIPGTIEDIMIEKVNLKTQEKTVKTFAVRGEDGQLYDIVVENTQDMATPPKNERLSTPMVSKSMDIPVFMNSTLGDSNLLRIGNKIEYIVDEKNTVRFISGIQSDPTNVKLIAKVESIDTNNRKITFSRLVDISKGDKDMQTISRMFEADASYVPETYIYSNAVKLYLINKQSDTKNIFKDSILKIDAMNGLIIQMEEVHLDATAFKNNVIFGVVEENNPSLGFVSLFHPDGSGVYENPEDRAAKLRTIKYDKNKIEVLKDGIQAKIDEMIPGDRVFIRLNPDNTASQLSASSDLSGQYGKVITVKGKNISVALDDGTQKVFAVNETIKVIKNDSPGQVKDIQDGDWVHLLLSETANHTPELKEIRIEEGAHLITNIYKGKLDRYEKETDQIAFYDVFRMERGDFRREMQKGFVKFNISPQSYYYENNRQYALDSLTQDKKGKDAYFALEKDGAGGERVAFLSLHSMDDAETRVMKDSIVIYPDNTKEFALTNEYKSLKIDEGTMIVKNNRLVKPASMNTEDSAYVVARRNYNNGEYMSGIIKIDDKPNRNIPKLYMGRIQSIQQGKQFTVKTYMLFNENQWDFKNTHKTFQIDKDTKLVNETGTGNMDRFVDYGETGFIDKSVYVLTNGESVLLINTLPFGDYVVRGEVYDVTRDPGPGVDELGELYKVSSLGLKNVKFYDTKKGTWNAADTVTLAIKPSVIVIQNGKIVSSNQIKVYDTVKVIKKPGNNDAYILFIES